MYLWFMLLKPNWSLSGAKRCQKALQIEPKVVSKGTLKREWTLFRDKNADMQFDPLFTIYIQQVDHVRQPSFFNNLCTSNYTKSHEKIHTPKDP